MLDHTAKAYSLRNDNKPVRQLPKTSTKGILTKSTLLLKCLAVNCVIGCVGASRF